MQTTGGFNPHIKRLIITALCIALPLGAYLIFKRKTTPQSQWYVVSKPITKDITQYITASGRLKARDQITIGSLVAGRIIKLQVDDNDFVRKDQVLVELDDGVGYSAVKGALASLAQAEAKLNYIKQFYARQKALYESGQLAHDAFQAVTRDYHTAKAAVLAAQAEREIRQQTYDNLFIKAPEAGIIISKKVNLGQMITSQLQATELFIIAKDLKKMEAEIDIDEADIGLVRKGQEAVFTVDAFQQRAFHSTVSQINYDYKVVENVITYAVILNVDNPDLTLRPGMTTNVDIKVAQVKDALCVPNKALRINRKVLKKIAKKEKLGIQEQPQSISIQTVESKLKETLWIFENRTFIEVAVQLGVTDGRFTQVKAGTITKQAVVVTEALDPERENPIMMMGKMRV